MKVATAETRLPLSWQDSPLESGMRELLPKMRWSYSRRNVLEQCPRRYYYEYYAAGACGTTRDPDGGTLRFLKSLQNRHERIGTIGYLVISTYFRKARSGEFWSADRLGDWARDIFRRDLAYSKVDPDGTSPGRGKFPPILLHEYYYRNPDASALCSEAEERLVKALHTFSTSASFAGFRLAGISPSALVEHNLTLSDLPCRVAGKLDLAFAAEGYVTVVDWKLGNPSRSGDDSLQLAAYALWASTHFAAAPDAITVYKAYLGADETVQFPVSESVLVNSRARIIQDAERMAALHNYGQRGVVEAFTPCAQRDVCKLCPFQKVCPEGRAVLYA